jgi:RNA polymerase sigma-70 factor (ECF subfamily)
MTLALSTPRSPASLTEPQLIERLVAGDPEVFAQLMRRYQRSMLRVAMTHVRRRDVAQEVVQETWLSILRGISRFERRSSLKSWMFRILTNRAKSRGIRERRTVPVSALGSAGDEPVSELGSLGSGGLWLRPRQDWRDSPEHAVVRTEVAADVEAALSSLPERQREVVRLRDVQGLTSAEVCTRLQISQANQRVLLHRGRARARELLGADALRTFAA